MTITEQSPDRPGFTPLYQQVRDLLLSRISTGAWRPAEALPSEHALAAALGVSQGTVRKALDSLAAEKLVERRQGKGTFVTLHTQESTQFRFFKLTFDSGERALPLCKESTITRRPAKDDEQKFLGLLSLAEVFAITRNRFAEDRPVLRETIIVSAELLQKLDTHQPLPNTLYMFYQAEYGISIASASERIKAVGADKDVAHALSVEVGAPVLLVERVAFDLTRRPIELRKSFYLTDSLHYTVNLG